MPYPDPLTSEEKDSLIPYSEYPHFTPQDATFIESLLGPEKAINDGHRLKWFYPRMGVFITHKIIDPDKPTKPLSIEAEQPWLHESPPISRSQWFNRRNQSRHLLLYLAKLLPLYNSEREGLKLYKAMSIFAQSQQLDFNELWLAVCAAIRPLQQAKAEATQVKGLARVGL